MPRGLIQYTWFAKERRAEKERAAFENYVTSFMDSARSQRKTCSICKNHTIHPVGVQRTETGVNVYWKCEACGRKVTTVKTNSELVNEYNEDRKGQEVTA